MATEHEKRLHEALAAHPEHKERGPVHTHSAHYERADNGGLYARVEKRHKDGTHSHTEHHVLMGKEQAAQHLLDHMDDQPDAQVEEPAPDDQAAQQQPPPDAAGGPPMGQAAPTGGM